MRADVHRFSVIDPGDVSGLRKASEGGSVESSLSSARVMATRLVNDYTRGYLMMSLSQLINGHTGESAQSVYGRVPFIFSRGVEGVLSPHYAVFTVSPDKGGPDKRLGYRGKVRRRRGGHPIGGTRNRVVVVGAGIAGSLIATGLMRGHS